MITRVEMPIPRGRNETIFLYAMTAIVVSFTFLAIFNLFNGDAVVASGIWLGLVVFGIWSSSKSEGGFQKFGIKLLGDLAGKQYVEIVALGNQPTEVWLGFSFFGRRFVQHRVILGKIESVEWTPGQATGLAGRDMKDWSVCLWFDHDDPNKRNEWLRKPDQDILIVGPARRKEETEVLGLSFVEFLRNAGLPLICGKGDACFVRAGIPNEINQEAPITS